MLAQKDAKLWRMNQKTAEAKIAALEKENQTLRERIAELERRLAIDSRTSSKPLSSEWIEQEEYSSDKEFTQQ